MQELCVAQWYSYRGIEHLRDRVVTVSNPDILSKSSRVSKLMRTSKEEKRLFTLSFMRLFLSPLFLTLVHTRGPGASFCKIY